MKVLIVEPEVKGHFISLYVLNILKSLNKNHKVYLLTSKKILNTEVLKLINKDYPSLKILFTDNLEYPKLKNPISLFYFQHINFEKVRKKIMFMMFYITLIIFFLQILITMIKYYAFTLILLNQNFFQEFLSTQGFINSIKKIILNT